MIDKNSAILITGATGFIGSYIARKLYKSGYTQLTLIHRASSSLDLITDIKDKVELVTCDILDHPKLLKLTKNKQLVIHAAASVSLSSKAKEKMKKVNIGGTKNIVNCCIANKVQRLLHISSVAALGKGEKEELINEKRDWVIDKYNSDYAITKYESEMEVWRGQEEGLEVSIINPGVVLGAGRWTDSSLMMMPTIDKGVSYYPQGSNGMVDVRDIADMCLLMIEKNIIGHRIIAVAEEVNLKYLTDTIAEQINAKKPKIAVKKWMIPFLWRLFSIKKWITGSNSGITRAMLVNTSKKWIYDNSKSKTLLDFEYKPIKQSIQDMCKAYMDSKAHKQGFSRYNF